MCEVEFWEVFPRKVQWFLNVVPSIHVLTAE